MAKTISLEFNGYWLDENRSSVPAEAGIYCVYTCSRAPTGVRLHRLIYIGESENAQARINTHERRGDWERLLEPGQQLCYTFAPTLDRVRAECALVFLNKPPLNKECKSHFGHPETTVKVTGRTEYLHGGTAP